MLGHRGRVGIEKIDDDKNTSSRSNAIKMKVSRVIGVKLESYVCALCCGGRNLAFGLQRRIEYGYDKHRRGIDIKRGIEIKVWVEN